MADARAVQLEDGGRNVVLALARGGPRVLELRRVARGGQPAVNRRRAERLFVREQPLPVALRVSACAGRGVRVEHERADGRERDCTQVAIAHVVLDGAHVLLCGATQVFGGRG